MSIELPPGVYYMLVIPSAYPKSSSYNPIVELFGMLGHIVIIVI